MTPDISQEIAEKLRAREGVVVHSYQHSLLENPKAMRVVLDSLERDYGRIVGCWVEDVSPLSFAGISDMAFRVLTMTKTEEEK